MDIINKEQHYINIYKPALNLNATAVSSLGLSTQKNLKHLYMSYVKLKLYLIRLRKDLMFYFQVL